MLARAAAGAWRPGERLGDGQPLACDRPVGANRGVVSMTALSDKQAEVKRRPADPVRCLTWPPRPQLPAWRRQFDPDRLGRDIQSVRGKAVRQRPKTDVRDM